MPMLVESFAALLARLYAEQYTGPVVLQFGQGVPSRAEIPQPAVQIRLDKPSRAVAHLQTTIDSRL
jgi:hypothetical protein